MDMRIMQSNYDIENFDILFAYSITSPITMFCVL